MTGPAPRTPAGETPARDRLLVPVAGCAGLLAPVAWAAVAVIELARANIGHSLTARPERLFSDSAWHWPLVLAVGAMVAAWLIAGLVLLSAAPVRRPAAAAGALLAIAGSARLAVALLLPGDPHGYSVGPAAALCANLAVSAAPAALLLVAVVVRRHAPTLAWLSAGIGIVTVWAALWAAIWAVRSGASQPQLLAIEPVDGLASTWAAAAGALLLGRPPCDLGSRWRWPSVPGPGRRSAVALALVAIVGIGVAAGPFVVAYQTAIEAQLSGSTQVEVIHADAVDRTYRVHRPANRIARPGLVIVLHGSFGGGFQMESDSGFDVEADRLGWIVAYPDGVADGWDTFGSTDTWGRHPGADDIAFFSALIDRLEATDSVDPDRVYVTGLSRGGMMSYRLGCVLSDRIAAIAPVSGNMATVSGSVDVPCTLERPVSVFAIHGTADRMIPIEGGKVDIVFSPLADVIARWRSLDACGTSSTVTTDGPSTTTSWACDGGATVQMRVVTGGWHAWPSVSGTLASAGGSPDSFDASRLIADFFAAHPRAAGGRQGIVRAAAARPFRAGMRGRTGARQAPRTRS